METLLRTVLQEKAELLADKGGTLFWVEPGMTAAEATRVMDEANVGCVLVMEQGKLAGIFSERDVMRGYARHGAGFGERRVAEVMTAKPFTVPPSMTVDDAMIQCTDRRVRHLPVIENGELLGLVSIGDLVRLVVKDKERTIAQLIDYING